MSPQQLLEVAGAYQLVEVTVVKLLLGGVVRLAEARVDDRVLLTLLELLLVLKVEEVAQARLVVALLYDVDGLTLIGVCGLSRGLAQFRQGAATGHGGLTRVLDCRVFTALDAPAGLSGVRALGLASRVRVVADGDGGPLHAALVLEVVPDAYLQEALVEACPGRLLVGVLAWENFQRGRHHAVKDALLASDLELRLGESHVLEGLQLLVDGVGGAPIVVDYGEAVLLRKFACIFLAVETSQLEGVHALGLLLGFLSIFVVERLLHRKLGAVAAVVTVIFVAILLGLLSMGLLLEALLVACQLGWGLAALLRVVLRLSSEGSQEAISTCLLGGVY